jgi:hypothetical protein
MNLQSTVVSGDTKPLPPRFLMKAVFGSDFIYWSRVRLFGKSMSAMYIPNNDPAPPYAGAVMVSERISGCRLVSVETGGQFRPAAAPGTTNPINCACQLVES